MSADISIEGMSPIEVRLACLRLAVAHAASVLPLDAELASAQPVEPVALAESFVAFVTGKVIGTPAEDHSRRPIP